MTTQKRENMFTLLSYPLSSNTPTFGDNPPTEITSVSSMAAGGVANWLELKTINHNGTHIDAPYHFSPNGKRLTDLDINQFVFTSPALVSIPKEDGELVTADDLSKYGETMAEADLLFLRTDWGHQYRSTNPTRYGRRAPGFDTSAGQYLLDEQPSLKAIAMDLPSAASPVSGRPNEEGLEFHRIVLGTYRSPDERYLLLIEDVRIDPDLDVAQFERVIVAPLWLEGADAAPVTILAELRQADIQGSSSLPPDKPC